MSKTKRHYTKVDQAKFDKIKQLCSIFPQDRVVAKTWDTTMNEPLSVNTVDRIRRSENLEAYKVLSKFMKNKPRTDVADIAEPAAPKLAQQMPQGTHRLEVVDASELKASIVKLTTAIEKLSTLLDDKNRSTVMRLSPEAPQKSKRFFARNR